VKRLCGVALLAGLAVLLVPGLSPAAEKPVLAVAEFKNETSAGWWSGSVGEELAGALSNELAAGGAFKVVERDKLGVVLREQDLGASGRVRPDSAAKIGQLTGAQYLVLGTVTAFQEQTSGTGGGISIGGFSLPGGSGGVSLGGKSEKAYIAIDLRVVNSSTGELDFVRTVEATASSSGFDFGGHAWNVGGQLGHYSKTPTGKAIRACLLEAVEYLECVMVFKDGCEAEYQAKEQRRRSKTRSSIKLDE